MRIFGETWVKMPGDNKVINGKYDIIQINL